jgi:exosortase F-associated protein
MSLPIRLLLGAACVISLLAIFVYQQFDVSPYLPGEFSRIEKFLLNRTIRFVINDILAMGLLYAIFPFRQYMMFAVIVQILGLVLFLIPYFILKLYLPSYNGPLINFLHRIILNPIIMLLLIPAFYYQRMLEKKSFDDRSQEH